MVTPIILSVEHLRKTFKSGEETVDVLSEVSFAVHEGSACAIVGPSGSGKTTLIAICAGLERPTAGSVRFDGVSIERASEEELAQIRNGRIGFIFQNFQLLPSLTALENVMVPAEIRGENHARRRGAELLNQVGLKHRLKHYPIQLSGGEQQRVAIARALVHDPAMLIADEPTGNLDPVTSWEIIQLLIHINELGTTVLMATHNQEIVNAMRRRVLALEHGTLVRDESGAAYEREY